MCLDSTWFQWFLNGWAAIKGGRGSLCSRVVLSTGHLGRSILHWVGDVIGEVTSLVTHWEMAYADRLHSQHMLMTSTSLIVTPPLAASLITPCTVHPIDYSSI